MSDSLSQRYAVSLQTRICKNMVFYDYFMAKIRSSSWATDADAQLWLCYMEDLDLALYYIKVSMTNTFSVSLALHVCMIFISQLILHRDTPSCPTYTNQELLTIYRCNRHIFHSPDSKYCVMKSFNHDIGGRSDPDGLNAGHPGCHTAYNIPPPCGN